MRGRASNIVYNILKAIMQHSYEMQQRASNMHHTGRTAIRTRKRDKGKQKKSVKRVVRTVNGKVRGQQSSIHICGDKEERCRNAPPGHYKEKAVDNDTTGDSIVTVVLTNCESSPSLVVCFHSFILRGSLFANEDK